MSEMTSRQRLLAASGRVSLAPYFRQVEACGENAHVRHSS